MKGAVTGALVFEGLAKDLDEAAELAASGEIIFSPCHEHDCVGSMAGVTSASMFMHIVENKTYGICRETGKLIPKERLRIVPHATLCIEAKGEHK